MNENELRDYLYQNHRDNLFSLIDGARDCVSWKGAYFPPIHFFLQQKAEKTINLILENLEFLNLSAKELRLERFKDTTTRIDLFGSSSSTGLTIIELKKTKQTERESLTELLGYSNHFCQIFPGLTEQSLTSILVAPMQSRITRDAFTQELISNNKNILALIPDDSSGKVRLSVYYPDDSYYKSFENNLLDDRSMSVMTVSFGLLDGLIDSDLDSEDRQIPLYSRDALNTISSAIALRLEAEGYHSLVYASQKWGEIAEKFSYPNHIFVAAVNPFASFRTSLESDQVYGESSDERIMNIQAVHSQISDNEKNDWIEYAESYFSDRLSSIVLDEFKLCFKNKKQELIHHEIGYPNWAGIKSSLLDSVYVHNLDIFSTGLLRKIFQEYLEYIYQSHIECCFYYADDFPRYSYEYLRNFLAVWEIIKLLGFSERDLS